MRRKIDQLIALGRSDALRHTVFDVDDPRAIKQALCFSLLEIVASAHLLAAAGRWFDSKILLRSALEVYAYLGVVEKNPVVLEHLRASQAYRTRKVLQEAEAANPFLAGVTETFDLRKVSAALDEQLADLENIGGKRDFRLQAVFRMMEPSDLYKNTELYDALYRQLSGLAHPNIDGMIARHLPDARETAQIQLFAPCSADTQNAVRDMMRAFCGQAENTLSALIERSD